MIPPGIVHRRIDVGEVTLHVAELCTDPLAARPGSGKLVVLLHGFPECWVTWRNQLPALAAAGYRVVAPDLRGYGASDKPASLRAYGSLALVRDIAGLIAALGEERAHVVGHDWGGIIAWHLAMWHPERVGKLAILNAPHPHRMLQGLRTLRQLKKSWYFFFFQLPWLPEARMRLGNFELLRRLFRFHPARRSAYDEEDIELLVSALAAEGAATAAINYYRAALRVRARPLRPIEKPVLIIWGQLDKNLGPELAQPDVAWVPRARVERIEGAGHFVQADAPARVNQLLLDWLA